MPVYRGTGRHDGGKAPVYSIVDWDYRQRRDNDANQGEEFGQQNIGEGSVETALPSPERTSRYSDSSEADAYTVASDNTTGLETPRS